jgi:hypothetical protein
MNRALLAAVGLAISFGAGWSLAVAKQSRAESHFAESMQMFNAEASVVLALADIRNAQHGNVPAIIAMNCKIARYSLRLVRPSFYLDPQKRQEIVAIITQANSVISSLESAGQCAKS